MTADAPSPDDARAAPNAERDATAPAAGLAELGELARSGHAEYGTDALVVCDQLVRIFTADGVEVQALQGLDLLVHERELTALVGASGSGKPTGELDSHTAGDVFGALRAVNRDLGTTVLIVTHDIEVAGQVDRTVAIRNGRTSMETLREALRPQGGSVAGPPGRREVEYAVLDRNGRLQLPARMTERLGMRDRVLLDERADHIAVRPGTGRGDAERAERRA